MAIQKRRSHISILQPVDRQLLGDKGIALDEDAYARTIAGMGHGPSEAHGTEDFIVWSQRNFRISLDRLQKVPPQSELDSFCESWLKHLSELPDRRVAIDGDERGYAPDLASIVRILNHPAVQAASVFIMKSIEQADLRWQWPLRIGAFENDLGGLNLKHLADIWPAKGLAVVNALSREEARCEILVMQGGIRDSLKRILSLPHHVRACHIILIGPVDITWHELSSHVDSLLSESQAGALSLIACPSGEAVERFNTFIEELSHNHSYDLALAKAFPREWSIHLMDLRLLKSAALTTAAHDIGRSLQAMPRMAKMAVPDEMALQRANINWTSANPPEELGEELRFKATDLRFDSESAGASALSEIATAERSARREAARSEVPRFLQGDLFRLIEGCPSLEIRGLIVGQNYRLDIFIGPSGEGTITAEKVFDDKQLDWKKKHSYALQVMFAEPEQWDEPLTGKLVLPREGVSTKCPLLFSPTRPGPFSGRVTIYYRGRILQTALLRSTVFDSETSLDAVNDPEPLSFKVESEIRRSLGTLDDRRRFDACMVLNRTAGDKAAATTGSKDGAYIFSLDTVKHQLAAINGLMNDVANDAESYSKGLLSEKNAELLYNLAFEGNWIFRNLVGNFVYKSSAAKALRDADYMQIVSTRFDEPVPLEFVYDYPLPKEGAKVCKYGPAALKKGKEDACPKDCITKDPDGEPHICPLGFWGLSRVIERHQIDSMALDDPHAEAVVRSEPVGGRDILSLKGPSLIAASKEVPASARIDLEQAVKAVWADEVVSVKDWGEWLEAIKKKPVMLLALPHTAGTGAHISLEISGTTRLSGLINENYVKATSEDNGPLVILFGCDTANVGDTEAYTSHITVFRQADAAIVLGTVGTVLGKDAATVAARIVKQLVATSENSTVRFGEVLRQIKRNAVADSLMVAMCLVAFGDADWRLE
jgi:hypothetical protein